MNPAERPGPSLFRRLFRGGAMPTARIEAFSDGVFAIVSTLLVLSIQVPEVHGDLAHELPRALARLTPHFLVFALSFAIVCVWWVAHHHFFVMLAKSDRALLWLNCLFLLWLATIPFPTALLGDYPHQRVAVVCYGVVMTMAGISFTSMRFYAFYVGKLTFPEVDAQLMRGAMIKSIMNPVLHLIAVLLAWVNPAVSIALYAAIPMLFFIPSKLEQSVVAVRTQ